MYVKDVTLLLGWNDSSMIIQILANRRELYKKNSFTHSFNLLFSDPQYMYIRSKYISNMSHKHQTWPLSVTLKVKNVLGFETLRCERCNRAVLCWSRRSAEQSEKCSAKVRSQVFLLFSLFFFLFPFSSHVLSACLFKF